MRMDDKAMEEVLKEGLIKAKDVIGEALSEYILGYYKREGYDKAIFRMREVIKEILEEIETRRDIRVSLDYSDLYGYTDLKERYNPKVDSFSSLQLYLLPYRYALSSVEGKDVLDVGCGYGYGCNLFTKVARSVIGIDYDREVIRYARRHYGQKNCTFKVHDANKPYPFEDESVDLVFLSNVIEQLERYEYSFSEIKRVLRSEGEIILNTRNSRFYPITENPHHVFNEKELMELLNRYFGDVKIYGYNIHYSYRTKLDINPKSKGDYEFGESIPLMYKHEIEGFIQAVMAKDSSKAGFLICHGRKE